MGFVPSPSSSSSSYTRSSSRKDESEILPFADRMKFSRRPSKSISGLICRVGGRRNPSNNRSTRRLVNTQPREDTPTRGTSAGKRPPFKLCGGQEAFYEYQQERGRRRRRENKRGKGREGKGTREGRAG
ncbi:hypothetical protein KUCAC02_035339 [Chaenocephalus aceratus]|nr:hypothetical protein KUCAC02_035339 [Chaenocephalus aceratus]